MPGRALRDSRPGLFLCLLAGLQLLTLSCQRPTSPDKALESLPPVLSAHFFSLPSDASQARRLEAGERHLYRIDLTAGTFFHFRAVQQGLDVEVLVISPEGKKLFTVDSPTGATGAEEIALVADQTGTYEIEVKPCGGCEVAGSYLLDIEALRPAEPQDRLRAEAELAFYQAKETIAESREEFSTTAVGQLEHAARLWERLGEAKHRAKALDLLGNHFGKAGMARRATSSLEQAAHLFGTVGEFSLEAASLTDLGWYLVELGDLDRAQEAYQRAFKHHQDGLTNTPLRGLTNVQNHLGILLWRQGDPWQGLQLLRTALSGWRKLKQPADIANTLISMAALYTSIGEFRLADDATQKALIFIDPQRDLDLYAQVESRRGHIFLATGDPEAALEHYRESLEAAQASGRIRDQAVALTGLGVSYHELGKPRQALDAYQNALALYAVRGEALSNQAILLNDLGGLYVELGMPTRALETYRQALTLARQSQTPQTQPPILLGMAIARKLLGDRSAARQRIDDAIAILERTRRYTPIGPFPGDLQSIFVAAPEDYYDFLIEFLMEENGLQPGSGFDTLALGASEQGRAQGLLAALAVDSMPASAGQDRGARRSQRRQVVRKINQLSEELCRLPETAVADRSEGEKRLRAALLAYHEAASPKSAKDPWRDSPGQPWLVTVEEIQGSLDDDTLLLIYHLGRSSSFLWAVTRDEVNGFALANPTLLARQAREALTLFRKSHGATSSFPMRRVAGSLGDQLLAAVSSDLKDYRRLLFVPSGALQYVPFSALLQPAASSGLQPIVASRTPLVDTHQIVVLPSGSTLPALRRAALARPRATHQLAIIADPVFSATDSRLTAGGSRAATPSVVSLPRLRHSRLEAESILACSGEGDLFLDFDASRSLVTSGKLSGYRIIHFATHATANAETSGLSALWFSGFSRNGEARPSSLRSHEIAKLSLPAELVVLSACETAIGPQLHGEGSLGLTRAFFVAGTSRLVVSLWNVSDEATSELMEMFYCNLLGRRLPPAEALRLAQSTLRQQPGREAPYYWAGFVLHGEPSAWFEVDSETHPLN